MQNAVLTIFPILLISSISLFVILISFLLMKLFHLPRSIVLVVCYLMIGTDIVVLFSTLISKIFSGAKYNNLFNILLLLFLSIFITFNIKKILREERDKER